VKGVTALSGGAVLAFDDVIHADCTHLGLDLSGHFIRKLMGFTRVGFTYYYLIIILKIISIFF
jgi:hypothetical protein